MLEEQKAKENFERQQQIFQQEQNTVRLDQFWRAMTLGFHASNEDANSSLAILSLYLDTLEDYFSFYDSLQPQFYSLKANYYITLQSFFHFLKLF